MLTTILKLHRQRSSAGPLALLVIMSLLQIGTRLMGLLKFPVFIDESWHISFAQEVLTGHLIAGAAHGKLLVPIGLAALQPTGPAQLFIARTATALFSLLSFGLVYRLAADLAGRSAGLIAALLIIFNPYLMFYERLALIDTFMMTCGLLAIWMASRLQRQQKWQTALLCGLSLAAGLAVKGTGAVLLVIPVCALILGFQREYWRVWLRWLVICYGTFGAIWLPLYGLLRWRHINYFGLAETLSNTSGATNFEQRLLANVVGIGQIDATYFSWIALLLMLVLSIWWCRRDPRRGGYILLCGALPTLAILLLSPFDRPRYLIYHVPLLIVAAAAGGEWLRQAVIPLTQRRPAAGWAAGAVVAIGLMGLISVVIPFYVAMQADPAALNLPGADETEYVTADSAGFALPELAAFAR